MEEPCRVFKKELSKVSTEVCGTKKRRTGKKGTTRWNEEVRQATEEKRKGILRLA